jgi:hypothetical protein
MEKPTVILDSYKMIGGAHPETASVKNVLAYYGVKAPHTGKPFGEPMLLGIGGGLRGMYADFLDEAAPILDNEDLKSTANLYRALHERRRVLTQAALPDHIDVFKSTKELLDRRAVITREHGSNALEAIAPLNDALHELKSELNPSFPLSESKTSALFADIQSHLEGIYLAEKEALAALRIAVT